MVLHAATANTSGLFCRCTDDLVLHGSIGCNASAREFAQSPWAKDFLTSENRGKKGAWCVSVSEDRAPNCVVRLSREALPNRVALVATFARNSGFSC
jgi:hypothetical protein